MKPKVNPVFISGDSGSLKPFCNTCGVHHQLFGNRYHCPQCGATATTEQAQNVDRKILVADNPEPMVGMRKKKGAEHKGDFPAGATILDDKEISS